MLKPTLLFHPNPLLLLFTTVTSQLPPELRLSVNWLLPMTTTVHFILILDYYWGKDLGKEEGTVELIRNFDEPVTQSSIDANINKWISKHERPPVVPFDDRTIGDMFGSGKKGLVLFNSDSSAELLEAFTAAAKEYDGEESLIFTEVDAKNQHLDNFAGYIKLDRKAFPIVLVESKAQTKYVLKSEPTKENILSFLGDYKSFKYGLTDEVKAEKATETEEEL